MVINEIDINSTKRVSKFSLKKGTFQLFAPFNWMSERSNTLYALATSVVGGGIVVGIW